MFYATWVGGVLEIDSSAFLKQRLAIEPHASVTYFPFIDQTCARNAQEQDEKHDMLDEYLSLSNKRKRSERNVNADNVSTAIHTVKIHLSNIPHDEKSAFVHVQRVCPELVNDKHILQFLRVENFDTNVSYKLYCNIQFALPVRLVSSGILIHLTCDTISSLLHRGSYDIGKSAINILDLIDLLSP